MMIKSVLAVTLLLIGFCFLAVTVAGMIKYQDFFSRLQVLGIGQAMGIGCCCLGLFIYEGFTNAGIKILMVLLFTLVGGPIGTHIVDKVAYKEGLKHFEEEIDGIMHENINREEKESCR
jgi:multicomponent Na+:H+ antiporter subunit G